MIPVFEKKGFLNEIILLYKTKNASLMFDKYNLIAEYK